MKVSQFFIRTNRCPASFSFKVDQKRSGQNTIEVAYLDFTTLQYVQFFPAKTFRQRATKRPERKVIFRAPRFPISIGSSGALE